MFVYSGTKLKELAPEKDEDYELGANIEGAQLNPLNYAPVLQEDKKEELIPVHKLEGIIDECMNDINNNCK